MFSLIIILFSISVVLSSNSGRIYLKYGIRSFTEDIFGYIPSAGNWTSFDEFPRLVGDFDGDKQTDCIGFYNTETSIAYCKFFLLILIL